MPNKKSIEALLNSAKARKRPGVDRKIKLTAENETLARYLGDGSISDGISEMFDFLKLLALNPDNDKAELISAILSDLKNFLKQNKSNA